MQKFVATYRQRVATIFSSNFQKPQCFDTRVESIIHIIEQQSKKRNNLHTLQASTYFTKELGADASPSILLVFARGNCGQGIRALSLSSSSNGTAVETQGVIGPKSAGLPVIITRDTSHRALMYPRQRTQGLRSQIGEITNMLQFEPQDEPTRPLLQISIGYFPTRFLLIYACLLPMHELWMVKRE